MSEEMKELLPEGEKKKDGAEEQEVEVEVVFTPEIEQEGEQEVSEEGESGPGGEAKASPVHSGEEGPAALEAVPPPLREPAVELGELSGPELIRLAYHQRSPSLEG